MNRLIWTVLFTIMSFSAHGEHGEDSSFGSRATTKENCGAIAATVCAYLEGCAQGNSRCAVKSISFCTMSLEKQLPAMKQRKNCSKFIQVDTIDDGPLKFSCKATKNPSKKAFWVLEPEGSDHAEKTNPKTEENPVEAKISQQLKGEEFLQAFDDGDKDRVTEYGVFDEQKVDTWDRAKLALYTRPIGNAKDWKSGAIPNNVQLAQMKKWVKDQLNLPEKSYVTLQPTSYSEDGKSFGSLIAYASVGEGGRYEAVGVISNFTSPKFSPKVRSYDGEGQTKPLPKW